MMLDAALAYAAAGLPIVPVWKKAPLIPNWPELTFTAETLTYWYTHDLILQGKHGPRNMGKPDGVGLALRDGFLDFDLDDEGATAFYEKLGLPPSVCWQSARGQHHLFKLTPEQASQHTANRSQAFKLGGVLEVRSGHGVQSVLPPSGGRTWVRSIFDTPCQWLPDVSLLAPAKPQESQNLEQSSAPSANGATRPGDIFNYHASWEDILVPAGWSRVGERTVEGRVVTDWKRPGETDQRLSATTGYCQSMNEDDKLYPFTTNAPPFDANHAYSKFEAYSRLYHGGDHAAAANALSDMGYRKVLTAAELLGPTQHDEDEETIRPSSDVFTFPGLVAAVRDWHLFTGQVLDPVLGAVAGLALTSWCIGQRVKLYDGTRPNLSFLIVGEPGAGKTDVKNTLLRLMSEAGYGESLESDIVSGPALEESLLSDPVKILIRDEMQDILSGKATQNLYTLTMLSRMKEAYSASGTMLIPRRKATEPVKPPILQPHLVPLLMGTPSSLSGIPRTFYEDGFIARLFAVSADDNARRRKVKNRVEPSGVKQYILQSLRYWRNHGVTQLLVHDNNEISAQPLSPQPREVVCTDAATDALDKLSDDWHVRGCGVERHLYRRGQEMVCKLAMVGAMSESPDREIDLGIVEKCCRIVEYVIQEKLHVWQTRVTGGDLGAEIMDRADRVQSFIRRSRKDKVTVRQIQNSCRITAKQAKQALFELVTRGEVVTDATFTPDGERFATTGTYFALAKKEP